MLRAGPQWVQDALVPERHDRKRGGVHERRQRCRDLRAGGGRPTAAPPADLPVPDRGHPALPGPGRHRPDHLPEVHGPGPERLPVLRQGPRRLLPVPGLHRNHAQLGQPGGMGGRGLPLLLPARGRVRLRGHRRGLPDPPADLPEHLRVLLHLLRGDPIPLGHRPHLPALLDLGGRADLGVHQAAAGVLDPRRATRRDRHGQGVPGAVRAGFPGPRCLGRGGLPRGAQARRAGRSFVADRGPTASRGDGRAQGTPGLPRRAAAASSTGGCWRRSS